MLARRLANLKHRERGAVPTGRRESRLAYSTGGERDREAASTSPGAVTVSALRLRLDRRASGRVVTVVTGLPGGRDEILTLARLLKAACGAGGTVKDGALELQGDHRDVVEAALRERGLRPRRSGG
jgi:translation initiation factor 1